MNAHVVCGLLVVVSTVPVAAQVRWEQAPVLEARSGAAMAYDVARQRVVLFGGAHGSVMFGDTWEFDGTQWMTVDTPVAPAPRTGAAMAYDALRGVVVLFGGNQGSAETWEWDGSTWTPQAPTVFPEARSGHAMIYDPVHHVTVLFGGASYSSGGLDSSLGDTWEWDGTQWLQRFPAVSPTARVRHAMAFDTARGVAVLFGGLGPTYGPFFRNDTWEWDGNTWQERGVGLPVVPVSRADHALVYDAARGVTLLHAGSNEPGHYESDLWEWTGAVWTEREPANPVQGRLGHSLAYDPVRARTICLGGEGWTGLLSTTEAFDGNDWTLLDAGVPPESFSHALAFDEQRGVAVQLVLLPQSGDLVQTWEWDGTRWELRPTATEPPQVGGYELTYDRAGGETLLLTGGATPASPQLWSYDGSDWKQKSSSRPPAWRAGTAFAPEPEPGQLLLFGGVQGWTKLLDTWRWDGARWQQLAPMHAPPPRSGHAMVLDRWRGRMVLFGGDGVAGPLQDTWEWDGRDWQERVSVHRPPVSSDVVLAYDAGRQRVVLWDASTAETWEWDGVDWTQRAPTEDLSASHGWEATYDSVRGTVMVAGPGTWWYGSASAGDFAEFGTGCTGSVGQPSVATVAGSRPYLDGTFGLRFEGLPPGDGVYTALGFSRTMWGDLPLPMNLAPFGFPDCDLLIAAEAVTVLPINAGVAEWYLTVPNLPTLAGVTFYAQALAFDASGPNGVAMTPAAACLIGVR